jgi:hypothetical protein
LPHQRADFFGDAIAPGFERFDFRQNFPSPLVELEQFLNPDLIPRPAGGEPLPNPIRFLANQSDVEHRRNLRNVLGNGKPIGFNGCSP